MRKIVLRLSTALLACTVAVPLMWASPYSFQTVIYPNDTFTQLLGINNDSTIAGYHNKAANQGFTLILPNSFTTENYPSSAMTQVVGINNTGLTDGFYVDTAGTTHGFTYNGSTYMTVDAPGTAFTQLLGVNNGGWLAGYSSLDATGATMERSFYDSGGAFNYIDGFLPSNVNNQATGVNNAGWVSGFFLTNGGADSTGYLFNTNTDSLTQLEYPGSTFTQALGVNNLGDVVGFYIDASGGMHGFFWNGSKFISIDDPNGVGTTIVNGLNDFGRLVGFYVDANGNTDGFVATPIPEPGTLAMFGSAALFAFGMLRRKLLG